MKTLTKAALVCFFFPILGWSMTSAFAQCNETELNPSDGRGEDEFGQAVALDQSYLAVGATGDDNEAGSVYLYRKINGVFTEKTKLVASDRQDYDYFGASVALHSHRLVVGTPYDDDLGSNSGSAYVYTQAPGQAPAEVKLLAADGVAGAEFGTTVATIGNRVVVGAPYDSGAGYAAGAVYVFRLHGGAWVQEAKLISDDIHDFDIFGKSVAVGDKVIAVGAIGAQTDGVRAGAVYVFELDHGAWIQQAKLTADEPIDQAFFGSSVAITSDATRIIAGFSPDSSTTSAAYIFRREGDSWVKETELLGGDYSGFGASVAINFPYCAVGQPYYNGKGTAYSYLFDGTNWNLVNRFTPSDGTYDDSFGLAVAVDQQSLVAGAYLHKNESGPGAVYIYDPNCTTSGH